MIGLGVLKILTPKVLKGIMDYVFNENELDVKIQVLENRIKDLESKAHSPRDFVVCETCKCKIKEK
jgi:hypothetical protein